MFSESLMSRGSEFHRSGAFLEKDLAPKEIHSQDMAYKTKDHGTSKFYYPIGNTPPIDVTLGCHVPRQCDMLLLGCGDIRNVLYTTHVLQQNGTLRSPDHLMNFHLNDNEVGIITRDLILFNIAKTVNPDDEADMKFLWSVWYDVLMSKEHHDRLIGVMNKLTEQEFQDQYISFGSEKTEHKVMNCLASWLKEQHEVKNVIEKRGRFLLNEFPEKDESFPTRSVASRLIHNYRGYGFEEERLRDRYSQEVQDYTEVGATRITTVGKSQKQILANFCVNMTFLQPDNKDWNVPADSSPFMTYEVERELEKYDGAKMNMAMICFKQLHQWVESFHAAEKRCRLKIYLWLDDARTLCQNTLQEDFNFDFIDTSNLSDEFGLMPLLVLCQGKLKEDRGVMRTETMDWSLCLSDGDYFLRLCVDIPFLMYPSVLGLHLAEEFNVGQERMLEIGLFKGVNRLAFRWKKAATFTPCTLTGSDAISSCLETIQSPNLMQSTDVFENVKPAFFDDNARKKVIERVQKITTCQSSVTKPSTPDNSGNLEIVTEYNDRYEVMIPISGNETHRDLIWKQMDLDTRILQLRLATGRSTHFSTKLRFSCPISIKDSKITYTKAEGLIKGTLIKNQELSVGERVLPWKLMTSNELCAQPDYPRSTYSQRTLRIQLQRVYPSPEHTQAIEHDKPEPLHQLQDPLHYFLFDCAIDKVKSVGMPRRIPLGDDSPLKEYQSTIILEGHKLWEQKPTTFVTVYDHDEAMKLIREKKMTSFEVMRDIGDIFEVITERLLQGYDILARILKINSYRIQQDSDHCKWKTKSFIRTRYPLKTGQAFIRETGLMKYTEDGDWKDPSFPEKYIKEILYEEEIALLHSSAGWKRLNVVLATYKPVCDCCGKMTDCKICSACKKAHYCSRSCQKKAWPQHKQQCNK